MSLPPKHEATAKLMKYCAYQERCMSQVQQKLKELEVEPEMARAILHYLLAEGYVNEARYASSYVRGKYNHAGWGRKKIAYKLRQLRVPDALIFETLEAEIDDERYCEQLQERVEDELLQAQKKKSTWNSPAQRVAQKLYAQGFEPELVWQYIRKSPLANGIQEPEDI